jgi:hypothetical protein
MTAEIVDEVVDVGHDVNSGGMRASAKIGHLVAAVQLEHKRPPWRARPSLAGGTFQPRTLALDPSTPSLGSSTWP